MVVLQPTDAVLHEVAADPSNLQTLRIGAREVITTGHAYNISDLRLPGTLSGKTGTAEFGLPDAQGILPFHSWFVAFLPSSPGASVGSRSCGATSSHGCPSRSDAGPTLTVAAPHRIR